MNNWWGKSDRREDKVISNESLKLSSPDRLGQSIDLSISFLRKSRLAEIRPSASVDNLSFINTSS